LIIIIRIPPPKPPKKQLGDGFWHNTIKEERIVFVAEDEPIKIEPDFVGYQFIGEVKDETTIKHGKGQ